MTAKKKSPAYKVDLSKIHFQWSEVAQQAGKWRLEAWAQDIPAPIGVLYLMRICYKAAAKDKATNTTWLVLESRVEEFCRRQGVRTRMNAELAEHGSHIISGAGTEDGEAFMRSQGYKVDKVSGLWILKTNKRPTA